MRSIKYVLLAAVALWASSARAEDDIRTQCLKKIWPQQVNEKKGFYPFASYGGDVMCLMDRITDDGAREAVDIIRKHNIKRIMVASGGGSVNGALDIADEILKQGIDVYVDNFCFSSCANYIFLAGRRKYVLEGGVVAWHGAPAYTEDKADALGDEEKERVRRTVARHNAFYARIGVDPRLAGEFPCDLKKTPEFLAMATEIETEHDVLWTYPREILEGKFHVEGVEAMWPPGDTKAIQARPLWKKVFLVKGCD